MGDVPRPLEALRGGIRARGSPLLNAATMPIAGRSEFYLYHSGLQSRAIDAGQRA